MQLHTQNKGPHHSFLQILVKIILYWSTKSYSYWCHSHLEIEVQRLVNTWNQPLSKSNGAERRRLYMRIFRQFMQLFICIYCTICGPSHYQLLCWAGINILARVTPWMMQTEGPSWDAWRLIITGIISWYHYDRPGSSQLIWTDYCD